MALRNWASFGDKGHVIRRLLESNRFWVLVNRSLYVRHSNSEVAGKQASDWVFRRVWPWPWLREGDDSIGALVVDLGRLGNATSRITKSLALAFENEWSTVVIPRLSHFPAYSSLISRGSVHHRGVHVTFGDEGPSSESSPRYLVRRDFNYSKGKHDPETSDDVRALVRRIFSGVSPSCEARPFDLTIHVRSGDIFFRENVGNWGQPPFAYYEKIIRSSPWERVQIVCEDDLSPVIQPIAHLCESLSISCSLQSSSLEEDLGVLVAAKNLVVGRGSFAPAVGLLAPHLKKLFFFEDRFGSPFLDPTVETIRVVDEAGLYRAQILGGNWINSVSQRELMLSYPLSGIRFEGEVSDDAE